MSTEAHPPEGSAEEPAGSSSEEPATHNAATPLATRARVLASAFLRKLDHDDISIHAMSLTYTTILSMVPLLAVTFSVLKAFGVHDQLEPLLASSLAPLGSEGLALSGRIIEFVRNMEVGVLGAAGVAGLFYTVITLVGSIEDALNRIWQTRQGRAWSSKFRDYLSVIMVGPVLVFSALALTATARQHALVQQVFSVAPWLLWLGTQVLPYVILATAFTLLYRFMPNTFVTWTAAAVGGCVAGVAWNTVGSAFTAFIASSARYAAIYSSFAILVLFFIWVYISWLIVLIGSETAYLWQHPTDVLSRLRDATLAAREQNGLTLMLTVARSHLAGDPPTTTAALALQTGLPSSTVDDVVEKMIEENILLKSERPRGVALAKPPESVSLFEVLSILRGEGGDDPARAAPPSIAAALATRSRAVENALRGITLKSLAAPKTLTPDP